MLLLFWGALAVLSGAALPADRTNTLAPKALRLEHNVAAGASLGFTDVLRPRFSWQLGCAGSCRGAAEERPWPPTTR